MDGEREEPGPSLAFDRSAATPDAGPGPQEIDRILVERARQLAKPTRSAVASGRDHLHFEVAGVRFAIAITAARKIVRPRLAARIPCAPAHLSHVIHVEGRIVSLLDLAALLGLERAGEKRPEVAILVEGTGGILGVLVDVLAGVRRVHDETLSADEGRASQQGGPFIRGTTPDLVVVIDAERLVSEVRSEGRRRAGHGETNDEQIARGRVVP